MTIENEWHLRYILQTLENSFKSLEELQKSGLAGCQQIIDTELYSTKLKKMHNNVICAYLKAGKQFPFEVTL